MVTLGGVGSFGDGGIGLPCKGFSQVYWSHTEASTQVYTGYTVSCGKRRTWMYNDL